MAHWVDDEVDEEGPAPWALGDDDFEPLARWDDDGGDLADGWLDDQLRQVRSTVDRGAPGGTCPENVAGGVALRHPAPTRPPRRRRADPDAVSDIPAPNIPGYVRDRRGTWRYAATGQAVPGARDLTLRALYRFPVHRSCVLVPVGLARTEDELAWCLAWKHTLTTRLAGGRSVTVLRVPVEEWERRADIPFGLWAPELTATRLLAIGDVARLAGVTPATITAYLSRRRMPAPVMRLGHTPVWSRPIITQWLATRPGQGRRP
jgi:predicted DNA-binding transcriptional regulator AlpA